MQIYTKIFADLIFPTPHQSVNSGHFPYPIYCIF